MTILPQVQPVSDMTGPAGRVSIEYAASSFREEAVVHEEHEGYSVALDDRRSRSFDGLGYRVDLGWVIEQSRVTWFPHLSVGYVPMSRRQHTTDLDGYVLSFQPTLWTVTLAGEAQFAKRLLRASIEPGVAWVDQNGRLRMPDGTEFVTKGNWVAPLMRFTFGVRLPRQSPVAGGLGVFAELGWIEFKNIFDFSFMGRAGLALSIDLEARTL